VSHARRLGQVRVASARSGADPRGDLAGGCRASISTVAAASLLATAVLWVSAAAAAADADGASQPTQGLARGQPLSVQEAELAATEARLEALRAKLTDQEAYRDALYAELERNDLEIAELARTARDLATRREALESRRGDLAVELAQTRDALEAGRAGLAALVRSAYVAGPGDRLRLLLNQQDIARAGRQLGYYRSIARLRTQRVAEVASLAAELERLNLAAEEESRRLAALAQQQEQTRRALDVVRGARSAVLADLEKVIADDRARVEELDANAAALRELVQELRQRARIAAEISVNQVAITRRRGKLPWPVSQGRLISPFSGAPRPGQLHADGVLFSVEPGSEIYPVHHGQVVYADWLRGFDLLLVVDHGDGYMSFYGHNQALLKEVGEWVGPGDAIALAGTGSGTDIVQGSDDAAGRLYFALRREGSPLNPAPWLAAGPKE
jgi:septal ring factor EnvC (AmiA/AmiB activator)